MRKTANQIADEALFKCAGYYQNIVGFDDPKKLEALRAAGDEYQEDPEATKKYWAAVRKYYDAQSQALHKQLGAVPATYEDIPLGFIDRLRGLPTTRSNPAHAKYLADRKRAAADYAEKMGPAPENLDISGRAKLLGGTAYGNMDKYTGIAAMYPYGDTDPYSGKSSEKGYIDKKRLLHLLNTDVNSTVQPEILERVQASPHRYFTSTYTS